MEGTRLFLWELSERSLESGTCKHLSPVVDTYLSSAKCSHRFRLINTSCFPSYIFSIDGHTLTVIEADGTETEPVEVDQLEIFAG